MCHTAFAVSRNGGSEWETAQKSAALSWFDPFNNGNGSIKESGLMKNKGNLANIEHTHHGLPETSHCKFKIIFCMISLAILCAYAMTQESTTDYWVNRADESMNNGSIEGAVSA